MIFYKVMRKEGSWVISLSDPRLRYDDPKPGDILLSAPCLGIWVSPIKSYVLKHYASGEGAQEVLLVLDSYPEDIVKGDLKDREPEVSITCAELVAIETINQE